MRIISVIPAIVLLAVSTSFAEDRVSMAYRADLSATIDRFVEAELGEWQAFYRDLHAHPELSLQEARSSEAIAKRLAAMGYDVTTGVGGHGVVGVLKNGEGPTVLFRGDMDALPVKEETGLDYASTVTSAGVDGGTVGVMHACGHDVHQTCLVGTAALLASVRDEWRGTVIALAQPAEEIGAGARMMIEDGLFERFPKPDYCLGLHVSPSMPAGSVGYTAGWALANVDSVDITIYGRGGHGSRPHETIDPVVTAAQVVVALQTIVSRRLDPVEPGVITVGSIRSGSKHNIIPNDAHMQLTVRSYTDQVRALLLDGVREVTTHTCRAMGCTRDPSIHVRDEEFTPATYNDPELASKASDVLGRVVGAGRVEIRPAQMGGEDFGRYPRHLGVPGLMFWLGAVERKRYEASMESGGAPLPSIHSSTFAPDPEPTIRTGVRTMSSLVLSLLADAD